jgi:diguanylate cyclase (GGDEF)-like protein
MLASGEHDEAFYRKLWNDLEGKGEWEGEIINRHKNGHTVPERMTISVVRDGDGAIQHYIGVFTDISLQKQLVRELQHSAHHDLLTGLPNRALLYDRLGLALAQARRARSSVAVILLALDGFKPVKDTYGQVVGDELLRRLAQRMRGVVRDGDTLARLGGDEFVVVANAVADEEDATACAERVLAAIGEPVTLKTAGTTVRLSASVGVVVCPPTASEEDALPEAVLGRADVLMYEAKRAGKARVVVQRFVP